MPGPSIPPHIGSPFAPGGQAPIVPYSGPSTGVPVGAIGLPTSSLGCFLCPPPGVQAAMREIDPATCQAYLSGAATVPSGYTLSKTPCGAPLPLSVPGISPSPLPGPAPGPSPQPIQPSPPGGGVAPTGQTYGTRGQTVPGAMPSVSVNGQPMICCPCNQ